MSEYDSQGGSADEEEELIVEIVKTIKTHPNYGIDCDGNVYNYKEGIILNTKKHQLKPDGYYITRLFKDGKETKFYVARLVAEYFLTGFDPTDKDMFIDHIDRNPANNHFSNLRVTTRSQQQYNRNKPKNNTSGYYGVSKASKTTWSAEIAYKDENGDSRRIRKRFTDVKEAARYRDSLVLKYHKEFHGELNFPI
jgi:hypothetical protein